MKRKSGLNSLRFYSSIGDMLPKTEEWSSTVAQNMGIEYAKRRGNNLSFSEQQLLARAYREMSIGAYGVSGTEFEASPMGQVFGLFRRYNQSMNHYITQEIRAGRKRNLYNAQAASMFDQFCGDIQYTSKGNIYKTSGAYVGRRNQDGCYGQWDHPSYNWVDGLPAITSWVMMIMGYSTV